MSHMDTNQLLELAALDVLGVLDPEERDAFEAAFSAAPPELQAQIRREQLRVARNERLLPKVETPLGLRARVLAALREAMQTVGARKEVAGRISPAALELAPVQGVNRWWRAASIGAVAAAIAMTTIALQFRSDYSNVQTVMKSDDISQAMQKHFGTWLERDLLSPTTRHIAFSPVGAWSGNPEGVAKCVVLLDTAGSRGQMFVKNLPINVGYTLVGLDKDGKVVKRFVNVTATALVIDQVGLADFSLEGVVSLAIAESGSLDSRDGPKLLLKSAVL